MIQAPAERQATAERALAESRQARPPLLQRVLGHPWLILVALGLFGLGVRLWNLERASLVMDEFGSLRYATSSFEDTRLALATNDPNMSLYFWALWGWMRLVGFGAGDAAVRLLSVLAGAAAVPLTYLVGRRLHSPAAGLGAAGLLALNPFHVLPSQEVRSYSTFGSLALVSYLLLDRALRRGRWWDWTLHGLVTTLAFYSHFYTAFTVLAQGLYVLSRRSRAALIGLIGSGLLLAALLSPLVPYFARPAAGERLVHLGRPDAGDLVGFFIAAGGGSRASLALYAGLALVGLVLARGGARPPGARAWLLGSWLIVPLGLAFGLSQLSPIFHERYLIATLPVLPLLAGLGLARLPRALAVLAFGAAAALSLGTLREGEFEVRRGEEWRRAAAYTLADARPGDGYIFISKWGQNAFEHYAGWGWGQAPAAPYADILEPFDLRQVREVPKWQYRGLLAPDGLEPFAASHPRIWLVLSHEYDSVVGGDVAEPVRDWLTRHGYAARQRQFRSVRVLLYERRGPQRAGG